MNLEVEKDEVSALSNITVIIAFNSYNNHRALFNV